MGSHISTLRWSFFVIIGAMSQNNLNFSIVAKRCSDAAVVGIGESTHGTHEFFEAKATIFKKLIKYESIQNGNANITKEVITSGKKYRIICK